MQRIFKAQKALFMVFAVLSCVVFAYTLSFMTDFSPLFGLELKQNEFVSQFHDVFMQGFNKTLFTFAVYGVVLIAVGSYFQLGKYVPDGIAAVVMSLALAGVLYSCYYALINLPDLQVWAVSLDYSKLAMEGIDNFQLNTRIFPIGMALYGVYAVVSAALIAVMIAGNRIFKKSEAKAA